MLKTILLGGTLPRNHWLRRWLNWFHGSEQIEEINNTCDLHKASLSAGFWTLLIALFVGLVALGLIASLIANPVGLLTTMGLSALMIVAGMGIMYACGASKTVEWIVLVILLIFAAAVVLASLAVISILTGMVVGPYLHQLLPGIVPEIPSGNPWGPELWVGFVTLVASCATVYGLIHLVILIWEPLHRLQRQIVESAWWKSLKGTLCCPFAWTD